MFVCMAHPAAGATDIIECCPVSKDIIWSVYLAWVHKSILWWCAHGTQWFSLPVARQQSSDWGFMRRSEPQVNRIEWGMLSQRTRLTLRADCLQLQWSTIAIVCGPMVNEGLLWELTRGLSHSNPTSIWLNSCRSQDFHAENYAAQTRALWLFHYLHSLGLSWICWKWPSCDYCPTKHPVFGLCWILQCNPASFNLFTQKQVFILEVFPDWIFSLPHPSPLISLPKLRHWGEVSENQVKLVELVHY